VIEDMVRTWALLVETAHSPQQARPSPPPAGQLHADKTYDQPALRREISHRGIRVRIAHKGIESSTRLGRHRWIVESCLSWLHRNRRMVRAFADLAGALLAYRRLVKVTN